MKKLIFIFIIIFSGLLYANNPFPNYLSKVNQKTLDQMLNSILRNITMPIQDENQELTSVKYFDYIESNITSAYPNQVIKVSPSGGVIRSAIAYLFEQFHLDNIDINDQQAINKKVQEIIQNKNAISSIDIRGVGSDWDLYMSCENCDKPTLKKVRTKVRNLSTNLLKAGQRADTTLYAVPDIKDLHQQLKRSVRQGGSTLDFLYFDLTTNSLKAPPDDILSHNVNIRQPNIIKQMMEGYIEYAKPAQAYYRENPTVTTIRGIRPLLELPMLKYTESSEEILTQEIINLGDDFGSKELDYKVKRQFTKSFLNSRFSGGNNFIYESKSKLAKAINKINQNYKNKFKSFLIPIYGNSRPVATALSTEIDHFLIKDPPGIIYHGTSTMDNALAILRNGFFVSSSEQGTAAFGPGVYSSENFEFANAAYGGKDGTVFELTIDKNARVLNYQEFIKSNQFQPFLNQNGLKSNERDKIFKVLREKYKIDIIKNNHYIIQNTRSIKANNPLKPIIKKKVERAAKAYQELENYLKLEKNPTSESTRYQYRRFLKEFRDSIGSYYQFYQVSLYLDADSAISDPIFLRSNFNNFLFRSLFTIDKWSFDQKDLPREVGKEFMDNLDNYVRNQRSPEFDKMLYHQIWQIDSNQSFLDIIKVPAIRDYLLENPELEKRIFMETRMYGTENIYDYLMAKYDGADLTDPKNRKIFINDIINSPEWVFESFIGKSYMTTPFTGSTLDFFEQFDEEFFDEMLTAFEKDDGFRSSDNFYSFMERYSQALEELDSETFADNQIKAGYYKESDRDLIKSNIENKRQLNQYIANNFARVEKSENFQKRLKEKSLPAQVVDGLYKKELLVAETLGKKIDLFVKFAEYRKSASGFILNNMDTLQKDLIAVAKEDALENDLIKKYMQAYFLTFSNGIGEVIKKNTIEKILWNSKLIDKLSPEQRVFTFQIAIEAYEKHLSEKNVTHYANDVLRSIKSFLEYKVDENELVNIPPKKTKVQYFEQIDKLEKKTARLLKRKYTGQPRKLMMRLIDWCIKR